jgi:hypothetical protein
MEEKKPVSVIILISAVVFQAISGLAGGIGLISDPSGQTLGIPSSWLHGSPFDDYLVPGFILFSVLGIFPLILTIGLVKRSYWSRGLTQVLGLALIIWIIVEILVVGYHSQPPLQLIYGLLGILILALTFLPKVKKHYLTNN